MRVLFETDLTLSDLQEILKGSLTTSLQNRTSSTGRINSIKPLQLVRIVSDGSRTINLNKVLKIGIQMTAGAILYRIISSKHRKSRIDDAIDEFNKANENYWSDVCSGSVETRNLIKLTNATLGLISLREKYGARCMPSHQINPLMLAALFRSATILVEGANLNSRIVKRLDDIEGDDLDIVRYYLEMQLYAIGAKNKRELQST